MDLPQSFIFDLGWVFFASWAMVLIVVSAVAFGRDLFPFASQRPGEVTRH
jgi:hypothetical protein